MGAHAKRCMMTGYVRNATGIWRLWDMESKRIIECSDVKFDEDSTAYSEDSCNEGDPLGLPPEKPIYEEVQVEGPISKVAPDEVTTSTPDEVAAAMSDPKGTHKQRKAETHVLPEKAMSGTTETHVLPEKAMSGTTETHELPEEAMSSTITESHSLPERIMFISSCSSRRAHHVVLIASCSSCRAQRVVSYLPTFLFFRAKCGSSIYRCTLDRMNRTGLSHYAWNPLRVCECNKSIWYDVPCLDRQHDRGAMTCVVRMPFALTRLRPEGKCSDTAASRRKMP